MIEHEVQTTFDRPPEQVFDFLVDFRNEPGWNPDCLSVEKKSEGPIGVGTIFSSKMKRVGQIETEIVALDRARHCSVQDRARGMDGRFEYRFAPKDGGTALSIRMRMQPHGPMRLLEPVLGRKMKRMLDELPEKMRRGVASANGRTKGVES